MSNIPIILLAAGSSSRMGKPKQLLPWGETTLIEYQVKNILATGNPVNIILGNRAGKIIPFIKELPVKYTINEAWEKGMGTSIASGIEYVEQHHPDSDGVLITLTDQPLVTVSHLKKLLSTFKAGNKQIIVSQSASGWQGVPALFDRVYFRELSKLNGEQGAKSVFRKYTPHIKTIQCGDILGDIDTPGSYKRLLHHFRTNQ